MKPQPEETLTAEPASGAPTGPLASEHRLRWITPVTQPMMLCSQVQRSGGTLLTRLFDGHPACFAHPNELRWARSVKGLWPRIDVASTPTAEALLAQLDEGWPRQFAVEGYHKYSNWTHRQHPEQIQRYPFVFDAPLQQRIAARVLDGRGCRSQRDGLNVYLTSLFNAWLDYQNLYRTPKRWVTAFLPRLQMRERYLDRFFRDYPDGVLVTIVREPAAWLASFSRHRNSDDVDALLGTWLQSAAASVRAHAARPEGVVVILFEDLVERTEAVMRMLCRRMDIAFDRVLLEPTYNSIPVLSDSSYALVTGIDPSVTTRHRTTLSPAQQDAVANTAAAQYDEIRRRFAIAGEA